MNRPEANDSESTICLPILYLSTSCGKGAAYMCVADDVVDITFVMRKLHCSLQLKIFSIQTIFNIDAFSCAAES